VANRSPISVSPQGEESAHNCPTWPLIEARWGFCAYPITPLMCRGWTGDSVNPTHAVCRANRSITVVTRTAVIVIWARSVLAVGCRSCGQLWQTRNFYSGHCLLYVVGSLSRLFRACFQCGFRIRIWFICVCRCNTTRYNEEAQTEHKHVLLHSVFLLDSELGRLPSVRVPCQHRKMKESLIPYRPQISPIWGICSVTPHN
jgi:hypothetical protein